ncbi:hypothetical protein FRB91_001981 [Serendipita sp. 411]|nr:hypothetical protein FRB91_001981 [Serendipita sp. 411]
MKLVEDRHKVKKGAAVFSRLPAEVLGFIFDEFVNGGDSWSDRGSPWTLALVNRFWCATAIGTPRLWSTIMITNSPYAFWNGRKPRHNLSSLQVDGSTLRYPSMHSSAQVCGSLKRLRHILSRAGVSPLHVIIAFRDSDDGFENHVAPAVVQMYHELFTPPVSHRIDHLELDSSMLRYVLSWFSMPYAPRIENPAPSAPQLPSVLDQVLLHQAGNNSDSSEDEGSSVSEERLLDHTDIFKGPLSSLRFVTFYDPNISENWPIIELVIQASSVTLEGINFCLQSIPQRFVEQELWSSIKCIQTNSPHFLNSVLSKDVALEQLNIAGTKTKWKTHNDIPTPWPDRRTPNINFTQLTSLSLVIDDFSTLSRLTFPVLQNLEITAGSRYHNGFSSSNFHMISVNNAEMAATYAHPDFLVPLPALKSLSVRSPHCAPLGRFDMPVLETLRLTSECTPKLKCDKDLEPLFPNFEKKTKRKDGEGDGGEEEDDDDDPISVTNPSGMSPPAYLKTIRHFYFTADLTDLAVLRILQLLPSLHTLYLTPPTKIGLKIFEALASGKVVSRQRTPMAPDLRVLRVDCSGRSGDDKRKKAYKKKLKTTSMMNTTTTAAEGPGGAEAEETEDVYGAKTADGFVTTMERVAMSRRRYWQPLERCEVVWANGDVQSF